MYAGRRPNMFAIYPNFKNGFSIVSGRMEEKNIKAPVTPETTRKTYIGKMPLDGESVARTLIIRATNANGINVTRAMPRIILSMKDNA